jgi:TPP-dependent 2-oxoacid decarboxylase
MGREDVRQYVESSDCVILLGAFMTDINLGIYTARLDPARSIYATSEKLSIRYHTYEEVRFKDFLPACRLRLRLRKLGKILTRAGRSTPALALRTSHTAHRQTPLRAAQRVPHREHRRRGRCGRRFIRGG